MNIKKRIIRTLILAAIGLVIGGGISYMQIQKEQSLLQRGPKTSVAMPGIALGGPFTLVNQSGENVTEKNFEGDYKLIYFGFTYCPAICPTELQKISQVMKSVSEEDAARIQPLFITLDPERDTVDVMREYVALFHPKLVGLTGTVAQIEDVKASYKVFSSRVETEEGNDYSVDHSSFIYFMSPEGTVLGIYRMEDDADFITNEVRDLLKASS